MDPAAILCKELSRAGAANINPDAMRRVLQAAGLALTGGARQAAEDHLAEVRRLTGAAA